MISDESNGNVGPIDPKFIESKSAARNLAARCRHNQEPSGSMTSQSGT